MITGTIETVTEKPQIWWADFGHSKVYLHYYAEMELVYVNGKTVRVNPKSFNDWLALNRELGFKVGVL